jgi:hypothetical protein
VRGSKGSESLLPLEDLGAPIDVLWFAVPKPERGTAVLGSIRGNPMIVQIDRGDYWQCAYLIAKGSADAVREKGIEALRGEVKASAPDLPDLETALPDFSAVKLLSVALDRLTRWHRPGLLASELYRPVVGSFLLARPPGLSLGDRFLDHL